MSRYQNVPLSAPRSMTRFMTASILVRNASKRRPTTHSASFLTTGATIVVVMQVKHAFYRQRGSRAIKQNGSDSAQADGLMARPSDAASTRRADASTLGFASTRELESISRLDRRGREDCRLRPERTDYRLRPLPSLIARRP
jgi:hypothetical protein